MERYQADTQLLNQISGQQSAFSNGDSERERGKVEKIRSAATSSELEYKGALQVLQETVDNWNRNWGSACDKFQELEEQRITNLKTALWNYANILSQTCVIDDESCEKIRIALEGCDVDTEIQHFIAQKRTGNEVPEGPLVQKYRPGQSPQQTPFDRSSTPETTQSGKSHRYRSKDNHSSNSLSRRGSTSTSSRTLLNESPKSMINQHPLDGITQLCRSDSSATFNSMANSAVGSTVTASSVYSSVHGSHKHTPNMSLSTANDAVPHDTVRQPVRRKSFIERVDFSWPSRRSSIPAKPESPKPLKAQRTGGSMFDALRPARSRSRAGIRAETLDRDIDVPLATDPRATNVLNIGQNMLPVTAQARAQTPEVQTETFDPIASALAKLKLHSRPNSMVDSDTSRNDRVYDNLGRAVPQKTMRRAVHNRVPSRSEPSSPVSGADFDYPPRQHPNTYTSTNARHSGLGAPPPAHSAEEMRQTADRFSQQKDSILHGRSDVHNSRRLSRSTIPDAYSDEQLYAAASRSRAPSPQLHSNYSQSSAPGDLRRSPSPNPQARIQRPISRNSSTRPISSASQQTIGRASPRPSSSVMHEQRRISSSRTDSDFGLDPYRPNHVDRPRAHSPAVDVHRPVSPRPQLSEDRTRSRSRQSLHSNHSGGSGFTVEPRATGRPREKSRSPSAVYGDSRYDPARGREPNHVIAETTYRPLNRARSKSFVDSRSKFTREGREILSFVVALYDYQATIPEEIGFCQGDTLAIVEMRQDGWWLGETTNLRTPRLGLVPSNFFKKI